MQVSKKVIKRLIDTGAAVDVTTVIDYKKPHGASLLFYSEGDNGINAAAIVTPGGTIQAVLKRTANLLIML